MRRVSLNARAIQDAQASAEIYVVLLEIIHPDLATPIRLSTDPTERIQADPLVYGTRSSWRGADPVQEPFLWVVASAILPSDMEDAPASGTIALEILDPEMARLVRSYTTRATIHMAVVLASSPDLIEGEWTDLQILSADIDTGEILLNFSREEVENELFPTGRMTRGRFPGLHI
ncbi:MAG: hypothetical protein A2092_13470 [Rhodobacteraceae bacterium GWE1_64_9]|nr:MAG: hypothetical protein A2092_13470 [Rhodobacteraceae bacterium GWE1_64_9]HBU15722.1 hypothetical protein [Gemmobacter sp.]